MNGRLDMVQLLLNSTADIHATDQVSRHVQTGIKGSLRPIFITSLSYPSTSLNSTASDFIQGTRVLIPMFLNSAFAVVPDHGF